MKWVLFSGRHTHTGSITSTWVCTYINTKLQKMFIMLNPGSENKVYTGEMRSFFIGSICILLQFLMCVYWLSGLSCQHLGSFLATEWAL